MFSVCSTNIFSFVLNTRRMMITTHWSAKTWCNRKALPTSLKCLKNGWRNCWIVPKCLCSFLNEKAYLGPSFNNVKTRKFVNVNTSIERRVTYHLYCFSCGAQRARVPARGGVTGAGRGRQSAIVTRHCHLHPSSFPDMPWHRVTRRQCREYENILSSETLDTDTAMKLSILWASVQTCKRWLTTLQFLSGWGKCCTCMSVSHSCSRYVGVCFCQTLVLQL